MISITAAQAAMIYLSLTLSVLFALWLAHHFQSKKKKILSPKEELYVCEYCHSMYSDKTSKTITRCPTCQCYNQFNKFHP